MKINALCFICMGLLYAVSCKNNCGGSDIIESVVDVKMHLINDTIDTKFKKVGYTDFYQALQFRDSIASRNGGRKCRIKTLAISSENDVVLSKMTLESDLDFVLGEDTIKANTNFVNHPNILNQLKKDYFIGIDHEYNFISFDCKPLSTNTSLTFSCEIPLTNGQIVKQSQSCWVK